MMPYIITNESCNLNCEYCFYNSENSTRSKIIDVDKLFIFLNKLRKEKFIDNNLSITGGEPTIHPKFEQLLGLVKKHDYRVRLNTNLKDLKQVIIKYKDYITRIDTSIDSLNSYNLRHNEFIIDNLEVLNDNNIPLGIMTVINDTNFNKLKEIYSVLKKFNPEYISFQPMEVVNESMEKHDLKYLNKQSRAVLFDQLDFWAEIENNYETVDKIKKLILGVDVEPSCNMGSSKFVIDADGNIYPCFHRKDIFCGNIYDSNPKDVIKNLKQSFVKNCYSYKCMPL